MSPADLQRIAAFRMSFARRQAAALTEIAGGVVVLDQEFAASHEHNQLIIERTSTSAELLPLAEAALGHLRHRRITIFEDAVGTEYAPVFKAAGYVHETELVMRYKGSAVVGESPADSVSLADLRPAEVRQLRVWMPEYEEAVIYQLADRRAARLRGADQVRFLAARDEAGTVCSWADVYLDEAEGIAQIEGLVTADTHVRRGYANTVLDSALQHTSGADLVFLLADPGDWPHTWYARRGFAPVGRSHVFTWTPEGN